MEKFKFYTDKIEMRSITKDNKLQLHISGYAAIPNKKDIYKTEKTASGKIRAFKSLFTDNAIKSMEKQAKHKKIFVDISHETGANFNIKSALKGKIDSETFDYISDMLKYKEIPPAKLVDFKIDETGFFVDTVLNENLKIIDEPYYNAIKSTLEEGFLNGISINFTTTSVKEEFIDGEYVDVIDDVDLYGISYVDNPALPDNNIVEVAMRSMLECRAGENMSDKNETPKISGNKVDIEAEVDKRVKAELKNKEIESEREEQKKKIEEIEKKLEGKDKDDKPPSEADKIKELKKKENPKAKGLVKLQDAPAMSTDTDMNKFKENLKEISSPHDDFMEAERKNLKPRGALLGGFGEMVNLDLEMREKGINFDDERTIRSSSPSGDDIMAQTNEKLTPKLRR